MTDFIKGATLFIGGALVGAATALLFTTKTGGEVRKNIMDLAEEVKKQTQDYCEKVKQDLTTAEKSADNATEEA